jgi:hypothetical protein
MLRIGRRWFLALAAGVPLASQTPESPPPPKWQGTWSASNAGKTLIGGSWTASPGENPDVLTGAWTIREPKGQKVMARGTWSASKSGQGWEGHWKALAGETPGRPSRKGGGGWAGSWTARLALPAKANLTALVEHAIKSVVSGDWASGRSSGAWSIRAQPELGQF